MNTTRITELLRALAEELEGFAGRAQAGNADQAATGGAALAGTSPAPDQLSAVELAAAIEVADQKLWVPRNDVEANQWRNHLNELLKIQRQRAAQAPEGAT